MLPGDASIYIGHSPSEYVRLTPCSPLLLTTRLSSSWGNDLTSVTPLVLHELSTYHCAHATVYDLAYLTGATGHIAAPPVYQHEAQVAGTANTTLQRAQKFCVLPPSCHQVALTNAVNGRLTTLQFYTLILAGPLASADPAEVAAYEPVGPLVASRLPPCSRRRCPRGWDPQHVVDHHDVGPCLAWSLTRD